MKSEIHIGQIIRYERKRQNLSQEELAMNICSREYIIQIEAGKRSPSFYIIDLLSKKLKCDLFDLYNELNRHHDIKTHKLIESINEQLAHQDVNALEKSIELCEPQNTFHFGEPFQFLCYIKAIYQSNVKHDYDLAITHAKKGLTYQKHSFDITNFSNGTYTNVELMLINCIAVNYCRSKRFKEGFEIFNHCLNYLDPFINSSIYVLHKNLHFEIQLYLSITYNISSFKIVLTEYDGVIVLIDNAISLLKKLKYTMYLFELLCNKFTILYKMERFEDAKLCYEQTLHVGTYFATKNKLDDFIKLAEALAPPVVVNSEYPFT